MSGDADTGISEFTANNSTITINNGDSFYITNLNMTMNANSYYEGTINTDNTANNITLKLDDTSSIKLTGNSYVTSLETDDTSYSNIDFNGYKLYVNGVAIN